MGVSIHRTNLPSSNSTALVTHYVEHLTCKLEIKGLSPALGAELFLTLQHLLNLTTCLQQVAKCSLLRKKQSGRPTCNPYIHRPGTQKPQLL